jgi:hypothetical protein
VTRTRLRVTVATACLALAAFLLSAGSASARGPLVTGIADSFGGADGPVLLARTKAAGANVARIYLSWAGTAPGGNAKPASFDPGNPADPHYDWSVADAEVRGAKAAGLQPLVTVTRAPRWASESGSGLPSGERIAGTVRPNAHEFGLFAAAVAKRYSGSFAGLPRVRYYQAWNEPNHHKDLNPQFAVDPSKPATRSTPELSPDVYRGLLAEFSAAIHAVRADNLVVAGGLAPFFRPEPGGRVAPPLTFMRKLLCISSRNRPVAGCAPLAFDVWAHDPYTSGDPRHHAASSTDISLGDLPKMMRVLRAARRAGHVVSRRRVRFWITEISWDSKPPDRFGVPLKLEARWVSELLYRSWKLGIDLVTWYQVRDAPADGTFQSGLYFRCSGGVSCDRKKPAFTAFRFPFVAFRSGRRVLIWGRTPNGRKGKVVVEHNRGHGWRRVARLRTNRYGIFTRKLRAKPRGKMRARLLRPRTRSLPFSLKRVRDRPVNPFGEVPVNEARG